MLVSWLVAAACTAEQTDAEATSPVAGFAGSEKCGSCHQQQLAQWQGSHHQLAMQPATGAAVLGDFSDVTVPYFESFATFSQRDGKFFVSTDNSDGEQATFEITHTFGVTPLQQYLVDVPGGRKQALQFAWDSRSRDEGGQRWYHLYPDEYLGPGDILHWTGQYFNWNSMCAECHSTNLELGYDLETNAFKTTYSEISVGCEACHGPGSVHIAEAAAGTFSADYGLLVDLDDRAGAAWSMNTDTGIAERTTTTASRQQAESCGRCHSRRSTVTTNYEFGKPLTDTHMPSILEDRLYFSDGRILEEVYVYGSFLQSKMYAAGITCSDCHNPHSGKLHAGSDPNNTCSTCHLPAKFATAEHYPESVGDCVSCHMPATTYMGVDDRRDHSFRLPGTAEDPEHYGSVIAAGRSGGANNELLQGIADNAYPGIARATMLTLLEPLAESHDMSDFSQHLDDPDPLVRIGALRALRRQSPERRMSYGSHLLHDEIRSVRIEAALTYVEYRDLLTAQDSRAFRSAAEEYRASMTATAAMPDAALNLAEFENRLGNVAAAEKMYEHALRIGSDSAAVQHAYGLHLVRSGNHNGALQHLHRATLLDTAVPQFVYVYGVALNSLGNSTQSLEVLRSAYEQFPDSYDIGWALATIYRDTGDRQLARSVVAHLEARFPTDARVAALAESLRE